MSDQLAELKRRVELLECRATVLSSLANRRVLALLYKHVSSPFNGDGEFTLTTTNIENATGLRVDDRKYVLGELERAAFVEYQPRVDGWRITDAGTWALMSLPEELR